VILRDDLKVVPYDWDTTSGDPYVGHGLQAVPTGKRPCPVGIPAAILRDDLKVVPYE